MSDTFEEEGLKEHLRKLEETIKRLRASNLLLRGFIRHHEESREHDSPDTVIYPAERRLWAALEALDVLDI
jgi:hypothetical protein